VIPGVIATGNIVMDVLTRPVDEITWGGTRWVESIVPSLGGNGANTSAALGKLGVPVRLLGAVGRDAFGGAALASSRMRGGYQRSTAHGLRHGDYGGAGPVRWNAGVSHQPGVSRLFLEDPLE